MKKYKIIYACSTHIGNIREENEDNFYIDGKTASMDVETIAGVLENEKNIVSVCDGMGGEANGKEASALAAEQIKQADEVIKSNDNSDINSVILSHIKLANDDVCKLSQKKRAFSGSTLNIVYVEGETARSYNLGDSRTYLFRNNQFEQLSQDHTTAADLVRIGVLSEKEARRYARRNELTQCIGIPLVKFKLNPHVKDFELHENDIILICSDGLTDMCEDSTIISILSTEKDPKNAIQKLLDISLQNGGKDNITIILLYVK